jgi:molybdopterin synthase sulfur carrier subunit
VKIELYLYASFKNNLPEKSGGNSCILEIPDGTTIRELLSQLNIPPEAPKVIFLNGVHTKGDEVLKDGDRVGAFPPVAGGSFRVPSLVSGRSLTHRHFDR